MSESSRAKCFRAYVLARSASCVMRSGDWMTLRYYDAVRRAATLVVPCLHSIDNVLGDGGHDKGSKSGASMREIEQVGHLKFFNKGDRNKPF